MATPKEIVMKFWENGNKHNLDELFALIDTEIKSDYFSGPVKGKDFFMMSMKAYGRAFPDSHDEVTLIVAQDDLVACEYIETATFKGPLQSPAGSVHPNGRSYKMNVASFFRVNGNGLITEMRNYFDRTSFIEQTGIDLVSMQKKLSS